MAKLESKFQAELKAELSELFPGCMIIKGNSASMQGIPDLLILWEGKWAALEIKRSAADAKTPRPNQPWYVDKMNAMSFARFVYPENKEVVLDELQRSFGISGAARVS